MLLERIQGQKYKDYKFRVIWDKVMRGDARKSTLDLEGVLWIEGYIYLSRDWDLVRSIIKYANYSRYSIYLGGDVLGHEIALLVIWDEVECAEFVPRFFKF